MGRKHIEMALNDDDEYGKLINIHVKAFSDKKAEASKTTHLPYAVQIDLLNCLKEFSQIMGNITQVYGFPGNI